MDPIIPSRVSKPTCRAGLRGDGRGPPRLRGMSWLPVPQLGNISRMSAVTAQAPAAQPNYESTGTGRAASIHRESVASIKGSWPMGWQGLLASAREAG